MVQAVILTGTGRYADPWHPMTATSPLIAAALADAGIASRIELKVDHALARWAPDDAALPDLVVANIGRLSTDEPDEGLDPGLVDEGLARMARSVPILAIHCAANAFAHSPSWEEAIGGRWIPGTSWHPERGTATVTRAAELPGVTDGIEEFALHDERYLDLRRKGDNQVLYTHPDEQGEASPSIWVRDDVPRRAYDALGHDERSYDSTEHRVLIGRIARWLLG